MARSRKRTVEQVASQRRWSEEDARIVVEAAEKSGLSLAAFCARLGLDAQRVYRWRRALGDRESAPEAVRFEEVVAPVRTPDLGGSRGLEVSTPSGHVIRLAADFDEGALRRVLVVLSEAARSC